MSVWSTAGGRRDARRHTKDIFAEAPDEVWMTTQRRGKSTFFLPFNHGASNSPVAGNSKAHYLWDEALQADSLH